MRSGSEPGGTRRGTRIKLEEALHETNVFDVWSFSEPGGTRRGTRVKLEEALHETNVFDVWSCSEPGGTRAGTRAFVRTLYAKLTFLPVPRLLFLLLK